MNPDFPWVRVLFWTFVALNAVAILLMSMAHQLIHEPNVAKRVARNLRTCFLYEALLFGALIMLLPFYWMTVTSFKDGETALAFPPIWTPARKVYTMDAPDGKQRVRLLEVQRNKGQEVRAVPEDKISFKRVSLGDFSVMKEDPDPAAVFRVDPGTLDGSIVNKIDLVNFKRAWFAPEEATRGRVNFGRYFWVSIYTGVLVTIGTLFTSALAAFAFAKMEFYGKGLFFYIVLLTMMVPGQVLLIPNFQTLSILGWLDTPLSLVVPFLASVFNIFLMRQFFMTLPDDLWDAAQIDGSGRFRFLWQIVTPLSKPVFVTGGIFVFLGNWNSLLWPLIVTSSPEMRTLMVGLQTFNEEAGSDFHLLMAASTMAILPIVILFFLLQRFFIQGIARTGLK